MTDHLIQNYPPWQAWKLCEKGEYAAAVDLCRTILKDEPHLVAARLIYARALTKTEQFDAAANQYYGVLADDPDNMVALKHLGDIKFSQRDEFGALSDYERVLQIDPNCRGISSQMRRQSTGSTRTITLHRTGEEETLEVERVPFFTETMGDLYLRQGHNRLAASVYRKLMETSDNRRLADKLAQAEGQTTSGEN